MHKDEQTDANIATLIQEAQQIEHTLRIYKRRVLRNYLIPTLLIIGAIIQIPSLMCYDCYTDEIWFYYAIGFWIACPFVLYFFLRTRIRLGLKIRQGNKEIKQIKKEIEQLSGWSSDIN